MTARVSLLYGNQQLLIDETLQQLIPRILEDRDPEWVLERFNAEELVKPGIEAESRLEAFVNSCESPSMLSDRKLIRVDNAQVLKQPRKGEETPAAQLFRTLVRLLEALPEHLFLILTSSATREGDFSKPLLNAIRKHGAPQKFVAYDNNNPVRWTQQRAEAKGLRCSQEAAQLLIDLVGNDLSDLDQELEKLSLFAPGKALEPEALLQQVAGHKHHSVFFMTESLAQRNLKAALETLEQQLEESPREHVRLYMLVVQQVRKLLLIHLLKAQGVAENTLLGKLGMPPFLGKQLVAQARGFRQVDLELWLKQLAENDLRVKFNAHLAPVLLKDFFQQVCRQPSRSAS